MRYYKQRIRDPEEIKRMARIPIAGPMAPRESVSLDKDAIARRREYYKERYRAKKEMRVRSKDYNPMADIHRGNA